MYRVFLGAPSKDEIANDPKAYSWRTLSSQTVSSKSTLHIQPTQSVVFPRATLEAASHRISLIYKDIVFDDDPEEDESLALLEGSQEAEGNSAEVSLFRGVEQTTLLSWPPSGRLGDETSALERDATGDGFAGPSFLDTSSKSTSRIIGNKTSQFTETQALESQSFGNYSDASSIGRFPSFHFNMHTLTSLTQLAEGKLKGASKVNVLLAVLEIEGPETIRVKKGADAGNQISILKMILGDEDGNVTKLTAWREIAEEWGGSGKAVAAKRGDIVHIENITANCDPVASLTLSASPYLKSQLVICYRTMPYSHEDGRLRPDLRLGSSEPSVRKVAAVVQWFEQMAGLTSSD